MKAYTILAATIGLTVSSGTVTAGVVSVEKRACNQDNVLRALEANMASATRFCTSYINLAAKTVEVPGTHTTPSFTETTATYTSTVVAYPTQYAPYLLPTYLFSYPTPSRISSACSCLSLPTATVTDYLYYTSPTATTVTTTTTVPFTGACATETLYPGAVKLTSPEADAFEYSLGVNSYGRDSVPDTTVPGCCAACSAFNPFPNEQGGRVQGYFGNCIGFRVDKIGNCTLLLQKAVGAGYLGPKCAVEGYQPGTLSVNAAKYPFAVGGKGQCASTFNTVPA